MSIKEEILSAFNPITLLELDEVKLLNRTDTKYVINSSQLFELLPKLTSAYRILEIENKRQAPYESLYFDTEKYNFYLDHHNGKGNRYKIRKRKYVDSNLSFFEIKNKIKGRTIKHRFTISELSDKLSDSELDFTKTKTGITSPLIATLTNHFNRLTLANQELTERVTIDTDLRFLHNGSAAAYSDLAIIEVKQERVNRNSAIIENLKSMHCRPKNLSKYCIGINKFYKNLKQNKFKSQHLFIHKITI